MSSTAPGPDNDYQFPPAPNRAVLDRATWSAVMLSVGSRLRGLEAQRETLSDVIDELKLFGLERLDTAIGPVIAQAETRLSQLAADIAQTAAENAVLLDDFKAVTAVNLEALRDAIDQAEADLVGVQDEINQMLDGGVSASKVAETTARVFVTPAQRARIEAILTGGLSGGAL
ncbi:hypothetical protein ACT6QG_05220 [Xanthobacter sp. TB0136]|uniref:hypothetical protein n=1 Tax=Xanthobacter sp. TB0136 TaxID=3459177 RepID=UPI00403A3FAB